MGNCVESGYAEAETEQHIEKNYWDIDYYYYYYYYYY